MMSLHTTHACDDQTAMFLRSHQVCKDEGYLHRAAKCVIKRVMHILHELLTQMPAARCSHAVVMGGGGVQDKGYEYSY